MDGLSGGSNANIELLRKTNKSQALPEHYQDDLLGFCRQIIRLHETHDRWLITCQLIKLITSAN